MNDSILAIATANGRGGVGIVRVSGAAARALLTPLGLKATPRLAQRVKVLDDQGQLIDDGLALFFAAPASYTGEDVLELQVHGSPLVLEAVEQRLMALCSLPVGGRAEGEDVSVPNVIPTLRRATPGEFTRRAFLNGKLDLAQAEAVADLIDASTAAAARAAARSLSGEFSTKITELQAQLIRLRMFTEATLDFPEEDVEFLQNERALEQAQGVAAQLERILQTARQGQRLREGATLVLVGAPNVGKSSLMNRLSGDDVAIVSPIAGTTRDTLRAHLDLDGLPVTLIDTAGLRALADASDEVERIGIERTHAAVAKADAVLHIVVDSEPDTLVPEAARSLPRLVVHNKIDLPESSGSLPVAPTSQLEPTPPAHLRVSAKTGEGLEALRAALCALAGYAPSDQGTFLARARHVDALTRSRDHLGHAHAHLQSSAPALELFAEELRLAHATLGEILGEFSADDLLGEIFGKFCIGK